MILKVVFTSCLGDSEGALCNLFLKASVVLSASGNGEDFLSWYNDMVLLIYAASLAVPVLLAELRSPLAPGDDFTLSFRGIHLFSTYLAHSRYLVKLIMKWTISIFRLRNQRLHYSNSKIIRGMINYDVILCSDKIFNTNSVGFGRQLGFPVAIRFLISHC